MCNPPFYESADEVTRSAIMKELPPNAVCTGAEVEMITPGGELGFVGRMLEESINHRDRCRWYTSMLGKLSSVIDLVKLLRKNMVSNYAISEFVQGHTRRWAIAWSFADFHLPDSIARISNPNLQSYMPRRNTLHQVIKIPLASRLDSTIDHRSILDETPTRTLVTIQANQNTWSRSARRQGLQRGGEGQAHRKEPTLPSSLPSLVCGIEQDIVGREVDFQWIYGRDRALFESFVNHVMRCVNTVVRV